MKTTGIVRRMDELGRVVIPKAIRQITGMRDEDALEFFIEEDRVVIQKYRPFEAKDSATDCLKKAIEVIDDEHADLIDLLSMIIKVLDDDKR